MTALTTNQLNVLQTHVTNGDRLSYWQTLSSYQILQGQDIRYALLAKSVADGGTVNGRVANAFIQAVATKYGVSITP